MEKAAPGTGEVLIGLFNNEENSNTLAKMSQTVVEFLITASKLIPDFDGKSETLRTVLDSLSLVDSIKSSHESIAVSVIKTKLKGITRKLLGNETTIAEIINKLNAIVESESVEVLSAKIMNIKSSGKTTNACCVLGECLFIRKSLTRDSR